MSAQYSTLREKIAADKQERYADYLRFAGIWVAATVAGQDAAAKCMPVPMVVGYQDSSGQRCIDVIADGACGFAWIHFAGTGRWANWAKANAGARKDYPSGLCIWISDYAQSMARKEAFANAAAEVLRANGIEAFARSRMD
jgi:hypothetical protein